MVLIITFLLLAAFSFNLGAAWAPDMMKHMRYGIRMAEQNLFSGRMLLKMKDDIGLTPEQIGKIEKMQNAHQEDMIKVNADIKVLELKLQSLLKGDKINRTSMEKMIRDIAKMRTDLQVEHINYLLDLRDMLTPEQLTKIDELKKEMRHKRLDSRKEWRKERFRHQEKER